MLSAQGTFVASFSDAGAAFSFCRAIAHSVLTPQIVEVADPGAAHLLFSAGGPARIEPRTLSVVISAAGQPEVVDRYAHELGHMASTSSAQEFVHLGEAEVSPVLARIREFPRLILEAAPSAAIFRVGILPTAMEGLFDELAKLAVRNSFDLITLTRASGIMYVALLPREGDTPSPAAMMKAVQEVFSICGKSEINASAMLEWSPAEVKTAVGGVWGPSRQDFGLMRRVKSSFDPKGVLSPGRFAGGI